MLSGTTCQNNETTSYYYCAGLTQAQLAGEGAVLRYPYMTHRGPDACVVHRSTQKSTEESSRVDKYACMPNTCLLISRIVHGTTDQGVPRPAITHNTGQRCLMGQVKATNRAKHHLIPRVDLSDLLGRRHESVLVVVVSFDVLEGGIHLVRGARLDASCGRHLIIC